MKPERFEDLIHRVAAIWWHEEHMQLEVWSGLVACRATLAACGYGPSSDEYKTLSFLLKIHHELNREVRHAA